MNPAESAHQENMLSAASAAAGAARRTEEHLRDIKGKLTADRAAILSEWIDRDMRVGDRTFPAGTVTIIDILDHAALLASAQGETHHG